MHTGTIRLRGANQKCFCSCRRSDDFQLSIADSVNEPRGTDIDRECTVTDSIAAQYVLERDAMQCNTFESISCFSRQTNPNQSPLHSSQPDDGPPYAIGLP